MFFGKVDSRVQRGDGRVVPGVDFVFVYPGQYVSVEHEFGHAVKMVGDGESAEGQGQVPGFIAAASFRSLAGLLGGQGHVGPRNVNGSRQEVCLAFPRTRRRVGQSRAGDGGGVLDAIEVHGALLGAGTFGEYLAFGLGQSWLVDKADGGFTTFYASSEAPGNKEGRDDGDTFHGHFLSFPPTHGHRAHGFPLLQSLVFHRPPRREHYRPPHTK